MPKVFVDPASKLGRRLTSAKGTGGVRKETELSLLQQLKREEQRAWNELQEQMKLTKKQLKGV